MPLFDLETFADDGILREQSVRAAFAAFDWEQYRDKTVHVRGCGKIHVPTWAYLMTAAHLALVARQITFGEEQSPTPIFLRTQGAADSSTKAVAT
jgi:hypothetical protein